MGISIKTRQAYSEIDEFIGLLTDVQKEKIPVKLRELFKKEKDPNYIKCIDPNEPIKNQNLKEETLALIALLNLKYWCEDEQEKERLRNVYSQNEKIYQEVLREKYNPEDIFKSKIINEESKQEKVDVTQITKYKENFIKRIINRIKNLFRK